jgi:dTDP-4-dehydrorhamnose 3,5-epimerase
MTITELSLPGLFRIEGKLHEDVRGHFIEAFNARVFAEAGIPLSIVQHNISRSKKGVIRGLHFQWDKPLDKLIRVARGRAFLVAADIRKQSPTYGTWFGQEVGEDDHIEIFAPAGFATGFAALMDDTEIEYYYSAFYNATGESNIVWNDPDLAIAWPVEEPIVSERDQAAGTLAAWIMRPESEAFLFPSAGK